MSLEAALWREVCRHLELEESVQRVFAVLSELLPLRSLIIRRRDDDPPRLTTLAIGGREQSSETNVAARTDLSPRALEWLDRVFRTGRPAGGTERWLIEELAPGTDCGRIFALPLLAQGEPLGVALFSIDSGETEPEFLDSLNVAQAPLCVAFENDRRLHELSRMREALEAERAALLTRLGRQDISGVVIGEAGGLSEVMERVLQVAPTDAPVLVLGETGSGKEVIARAVHAHSRRVRGPVVRVNCGAIPAELVDSELFGHERGAFTGATTRRKGWFERADGGTLFLDEIGELPLAAQIRLLRVLQDGTLQRVGGHQSIVVDVRIVAATHRRLETMVSAGSFREDLWYRLSVFPIRLPALRERIEDLPELAAHFADGAGKRLGGAGLSVTAADVDLLRNYSWPGNVRELAAVIERAAILGNGKRLEVQSALGTGLSVLPAQGSSSTSGYPAPSPSAPAFSESPSPASSSSSLPVVRAPDSRTLSSLDEAMATHIESALHSCHGRIEGPFGAARALGVNPHTLRARMRKLGIEWSRFRSA